MWSAGALLFDPIYAGGIRENFWGLSILVIDWGAFIEQADLDSLEDASYHYRIWRENAKTGERKIIAQCEEANLVDALEVPCQVPNDTWYVELAPQGGWLAELPPPAAGAAVCHPDSAHRGGGQGRQRGKDPVPFQSR